MNWWQNILPIQGSLAKDYKQTKTITEVSTLENAPDPDIEDKVLLIRNRLSRILFLRKFFDYPISLSLKTVKNLGIIRIIKIGMSYIYRTFFPLKDESTLENFLSIDLEMSFIKLFSKIIHKKFGVYLAIKSAHNGELKE